MAVGSLDDGEIGVDGIGLGPVSGCLRRSAALSARRAAISATSRPPTSGRLRLRVPASTTSTALPSPSGRSGPKCWCVRAAFGTEAFEQVAEGMGPPEMMLQAPAPALRHVGIVEQRRKQAEIAERHAEFGEARRLQGADGELQDAGFGGRRIGSAKPFEPGLGEFLRAQRFVGKAEGGAADSNSALPASGFAAWLR